jgi:GDPmannose 4,6-dehydratase
MWRILQQDKPGDYVIATGVGATVEEFAREAFKVADLEFEKYVRFEEKYLRATEVDALIGDASKAERHLGWKAEIHWKELARIMVLADIDLLT